MWCIRIVGFRKISKQIMRRLIPAVFVLSLMLLVRANSYAFAEESAGANNPLSGMFGAGDDDKDAPLFIKSNTLRLDSQRRIFTYEGEVELVRGAVQLTAERVIGRYDEANKLQIALCEGNVVVTKGEDSRATANKAIYRVASETIELSEDPELLRQGNLLSADKITMYLNEDRSEAEGNVRVKVIQSDEGSAKTKKRLLQSEDEEEESKAEDS